MVITFESVITKLKGKRIAFDLNLSQGQVENL